jgi:CheY-like chemotaxis protein
VPKAAPLRVLLVDDEPAILEMFSNYLSFSGFDVVTAYDGVDALERIASAMPNIVILDIKMPRMDGWETCERIKKDPRTCGLPVIFLTAFDQTQDRERARRLCVQGYVAKPCDPAELIRIIRKVLQPIMI